MRWGGLGNGVVGPIPDLVVRIVIEHSIEQRFDAADVKGAGIDGGAKPCQIAAESIASATGRKQTRSPKP